MARRNPKDPPDHTKWKPGQSGNPGGKPVAARNKLQSDFLRDLAADFDKHGKQAIKECRENKPDAYVRAIVQLMPKELEIKRPMEDITDADLAAAIALLQSAIAAQGNGGGAGEAIEQTKAH